jgi:hypothetical protein
VQASFGCDDELSICVEENVHAADDQHVVATPVMRDAAIVRAVPGSSGQIAW